MRKFIKKHLLIIIAVLYLLLPWDLIPDLLGVFGFSDDLILGFLALFKKYLDYKKETVAQKQGNDKVESS